MFAFTLSYVPFNFSINDFPLKDFIDSSHDNKLISLPVTNLINPTLSYSSSPLIMDSNNISFLW